jgi:hypothetical protein
MGQTMILDWVKQGGSAEQIESILAAGETAGD